MQSAPHAALTALRIPDPPRAWEALGFTVVDGALALEGVTIRFGDPPAVAVSGCSEGIDGVPTFGPSPVDPRPAAHPNGVTAIDHFVIVTPDFDRTAAALERLGLPLKRIRDAGTFRQGFRRLGSAILELVEVHGQPSGPARFWGLTFIANDLDALGARLGDRLRPIKAAVQAGRRIATLDRAAGLSTNVAFMDPA
jgi:hypothetical protein